MAFRAGYSNLPDLARPKPLARPVSPGVHQGTPPGNHATTVTPKPKTQAHPVTGMPQMQSAASIRAAANAQAWKTIQQQQDLLPSSQDIIAQYGARAAAILPLVDAHRSWLEKAGEYTVSMANGLASMGQTAAGAADQTAGAGAAAAGAPLGASPGPTVAPAGVGMPVAVYGTSTGNYLHSLVPYADAIGGQSINKINQDQGTALDDLRSSRQKIAETLPDLRAKNYSALTTDALNVFKGKLASKVALQTGSQKAKSTAATLKEKTRHDIATEETAARNATTSELRAKSAAKVADLKGEDKGMTPAERKSLQGFLKDTDKKYRDVGGAKTPGRFSATLKLPSVKGLTGTTPGDTHVVAADSIAEVQRLIKQFMLAHQPKLDPATGKPGAHWSQSDAVAPVPNSSVTVGKKGESTRRLDAWRYLVAQNSTLGAHALTEDELRAAFRRMEGAPK